MGVSKSKTMLERISSVYKTMCGFNYLLENKLADEVVIKLKTGFEFVFKETIRFKFNDRAKLTLYIDKKPHKVAKGDIESIRAERYSKSMEFD